MSRTKMNYNDWDTLLIPDNLEEDILSTHAEAITDYIENTYSDETIDLSSIQHVTELTVSEDLLATQEFPSEKITNNELFEYLKEENVNVDLNLLFPEIKRINHLFWFLHNLGNLDISKSKIIINNTNELSIVFYKIIEAAMFFGFLNRVRIDEESYFVRTEAYEKFITSDISKQYKMFLSHLGQNETVSEALKIQLNDPIYDNISQQMVYNILVNDPNLQKEQASKEEINQIVNNLRYWYLNIRQMVLKS